MEIDVSPETVERAVTYLRKFTGVDLFVLTQSERSELAAMLRKLSADNEALRARAEANAKDAERYRYAREWLVTLEHFATGKIAHAGSTEGLDEIIDAAIAQAQG